MRPHIPVMFLAGLLGGCAAAITPAPVVTGNAASHDPWAEELSALAQTAVAARAPQTPLAPGEMLVQAGDTLFAIARRHTTTLRGLIEANALMPPYHVKTGQRLRIPVLRAHRVAPGESLYAIAARYKIEAPELVRLNRIPPPYHVIIGQTLVLPGAQPVAYSFDARHAPPRSKPVAGMKGESRNARPQPPAPQTAKAPGPKITLAQAPPPRAGKNFAWPAKGKILSGYGPKQSGMHNDGINIAAIPNAPVIAAENGVVSYAGSDLAGYGNLLLIRHAGGWVTAYAHNSELLVQRGEQVSRGQAIARAGRSGGVDQDQVHFEIRRGAKAVNPAPLLAGG